MSGIFYLTGALSALGAAAALPFLGRPPTMTDAFLTASFFLLGKAAETR